MDTPTASGFCRQETQKKNNDGHHRKSRKEGESESRATQMKEEIKKLRSNTMKEREKDNKPEYSEP